MPSFDKTVKLACKPKAAVPKAKYLDPIITATWSDDGAVHDICKALISRLREPNVIVVFKALIVLHAMIRSGATDNILSHLSSSEILPLRNVSTGSWKGYNAPQNLQHYANYLDSRISAYRDLKHDAIRVRAESNRDMHLNSVHEDMAYTNAPKSAPNKLSKAPQRNSAIVGRRLRLMSLEKGLLRETQAVQIMIDSLVECKFYIDAWEDELTIAALRMLVKDLLVLFQAGNEGMINVLERYFEMPKVDAEQVLSIYRHFCSQTESVVEHLDAAMNLQILLNIPIPTLKHAPVSLAGALQEYLDDPRFEQNRIEYKTNKEAADRNSGSRTGVPSAPNFKALPSQVTPSTSTTSNASSTQVSSTVSKPEASKAMIDFFTSAEETRTTMSSPTSVSPTSNYFRQHSVHNHFVETQTTGAFQPFVLPDRLQPPDSTSDTIFARRCAVKLGKMLWEDALLDAQKVIQLNPSSYLGYELKNAALHGAQRYSEAIEAFEIMLSKLNDTADIQIQMLYQQYISPSEAHVVIQKVIDGEMENAPPRLIDTSAGRLCDRETQINAFKISMEYEKLLSVTIKHANLRMEHIQEVVATFFQYVMLSHRWEGKEPLMRDIHDRSVYEVDPVDGAAKLQSFCRVVRDAGFRWAWSDTCCINKNNNIELQQSVNSMFVWYRHSALTIVYLSDVLPSSEPGALAMSIWNSRGWTVQEFLAPNVVLFYQKDWTLYLDDHSHNHKESAVIMRELEAVTGINGRALTAFRPGMRGAREKLRWSSMRVTTLQEDIAYSLFGIFGVHLAPIYGENKQNALGRLLQEIIAQSGDITCLDWIGKPSEFNSCLPADIIFYSAPPSALPSPLSEEEMQTSVFSLRDAVDVNLASKLYETLNSLNAPLFVSRRLRLHCIAFAVTEITRGRGEDQQSRSTLGIKADGLRDLSITTEDKLTKFSRARPTRQAVLLVRPWDRSLLELPDFEDRSDAGSEEDGSPPVSCSHDSPENGLVDSESCSRALRLIVRLGQPFSAFLLAQQQGGEYKRIAADQNIIAQVNDRTAVRNMMDVRTLEIL